MRGPGRSLPARRTLLAAGVTAGVVGLSSLLVAHALPQAAPGWTAPAAPVTTTSAAAPNPSPTASRLVPAASASSPLQVLGARVGLRIGGAVSAPELADAADRALIARQLSVVTPENQMKWKRLEPVRGAVRWTDADAVVAFAEAHHERVRGHTLVWHQGLPAWLTTGVDDGAISTAELRALLKRHIQDEVGHFRGRIWQWDVVNEAFSDPSPIDAGSRPARFWVDHLGPGILGDAFRWAHEADPHALLFYNDYGIEPVNAKSTAVLTWATRLRAQGVPIDGIGFQAHLDGTQPAPADLTANLRRFAAAGFEVAITEADVRTRTAPGAVNTPVLPGAAAAQAAVWRRAVDSCLAVRACISFTVWGISDDRSWVPDAYRDPQQGAALLFDAHLRPKPQEAAVARALAAATGPQR